jgi:hypothetical protein
MACCGVPGTGAQWRELPEKYPPFQTCHRRFQQWVRTGKLEWALTLLARYLHERGQLNLDEAFVEATFASAKKGGLLLAPRAAARARRSSLSPLGCQSGNGQADLNARRVIYFKNSGQEPEISLPGVDKRIRHALLANGLSAWRIRLRGY